MQLISHIKLCLNLLVVHRELFSVSVIICIFHLEVVRLRLKICFNLVSCTAGIRHTVSSLTFSAAIVSDKTTWKGFMLSVCFYCSFTVVKEIIFIHNGHRLSPEDESNCVNYHDRQGTLAINYCYVLSLSSIFVRCFFVLFHFYCDYPELSIRSIGDLFVG